MRKNKLLLIKLGFDKTKIAIVVRQPKYKDGTDKEFFYVRLLNPDFTDKLYDNPKGVKRTKEDVIKSLGFDRDWAKHILPNIKKKYLKKIKNNLGRVKWVNINI